MDTTSLWQRYSGAGLDTVTGGYPLGNGYRFYFPSLMRFTCPDSMSPFGRAGVNTYAYCAADPINRSDPSGHTPKSVWEDFLAETTEVDHAVANDDAPIAIRRSSDAAKTTHEGVFEEPLISPRDHADPRRSKLEQHVGNKAPMRARKWPALGRKQIFPEPGNVFGLRRSLKEDLPRGEVRFELYDLETDEPVDTAPHGSYIFVNRIDEPHVVRVARDDILGHTSLTRDADKDSPLPVYFAGQIRFDRGEMVRFGNGSGHYQPTSDSLYELSPLVRRLLPAVHYEPMGA